MQSKLQQSFQSRMSRVTQAATKRKTLLQLKLGTGVQMKI
jgi:hypothetical protein